MVKGSHVRSLRFAVSEIYVSGKTYIFPAQGQTGEEWPLPILSRSKLFPSVSDRRWLPTFWKNAVPLCSLLLWSLHIIKMSKVTVRNLLTQTPSPLQSSTLKMEEQRPGSVLISLLPFVMRWTSLAEALCVDSHIKTDIVPKSDKICADM
jgi:hypothetical protein